MRGEEVLDVAHVTDVAVDDEAVGKAARLRALASVGGPAAPRLAGKTLAGVGDAERAVDERLHLRLGAVADGGDLAHAQLATDDDALASELAREFGALGGGDGHLGGTVDGEVGRDAADELDEADVLDDDGVDASLGDGADERLSLGELLVEDEDVHGDEAADAALVEEGDDVGELLDVELARARGR